MSNLRYFRHEELWCDFRVGVSQLGNAISVYRVAQTFRENLKSFVIVSDAE